MSTDLRIKFSRKGPAKYLGHLDNMRYFQKAILRAGINIKYSEGFNPHQILSFAYPLGVSMETEGDYADITVETFESTDDVKDKLNSVMNEGFSIENVSVVPEDALNAMASVALADYKIYIDSDIDNDDVVNYLLQPTILFEKENKKEKKSKKKNNNEKERETVFVDIKPGIVKLEYNDNYLFMSLISGSSNNIKPISIIETLQNFTHKQIKINNIVRVEIYRAVENNKYVPLYF